MAKSKWILDICNLRPSRRVFNCEDNEYDKIVKYLNFIQTIIFFCCNKTCSLNGITVKTEDQLYFRKDMNNKFCLTFIDEHNCANCGNFLSKRLTQTTPWISNKMITTNNLRFAIVCATIVSTTVINDFFCYFKIDSRKFLIYDLNSS